MALDRHRDRLAGMKTIPLLILVAILIAACGIANDPAPSPSAAGMVEANGEWELVRGTNDGVAIPLVPGAAITLSVDGSQISGASACNQYGGEIVVADGQVRFGPMFMTEMACDEPVMASESAYLAALGKVTSAAIDGDRLTLSGPGVELVYERLAPPPTAELIGTTWVLDSLITGDAVSSVMGDPATLRLGEDGGAEGSTGCRPFGGRYEVRDGQLILTELGVPDLPCDASVAAQDDHVVTVLGSGPRAAVDGARLTLMGTPGLGLGYLATNE